MTRVLLLALAVAAAAGLCHAAPARAATSGDILGHIIAGYQGWLCEPGDGSPVGSLPAGRGNYHGNYETYPDLREFPTTEQFAPPASWPNFPNGNPARLFSSDRDFTAELHTRWMRQYGVDVAAIQRFAEVSDPVYGGQKNDVTKRMLRAAERNGVKIYIEYDTSGSGRGSWGENFANLEKDWNDFAVGEKIIDSPAYARQNGKPVVEVWGLGLHDNNISTDPAQWAALLKFFHDRGVYVIAGTATGWRTATGDGVPGFDDVYTKCDAINPWIVGRFNSTDGADRYANEKMKPDLAWCKEHKVDYIPCVFPGTSFFNSNHRTKNIIPRNNGKLMWQQFANLRNAGISTCFISMFDEYNEATAIAKSATDASMIPDGQWFLTLDADGGSLSSDFYLRLTADAARMLKGETPLRWDLPTPPRNDLFRTGFEAGQPQPGSPLETGRGQSVQEAAATIFAVKTDKAQSGTASLFVSGAGERAKGGSWRTRIYDFTKSPLPIDRQTILYYWLNPQNASGRNIAIDLHFTDGSTLSASGLKDQNGAGLDGRSGHGDIGLNTWSVVAADVGKLAGKKVDGIWVVYDKPGGADTYAAYIDDIELSH